jgi:serine/tyrosine/threonine adenylyltransferase
MGALRFDNRTLADLPGDDSRVPGSRQVHGAAWSRVDPTPVAAPRLIAASADAAALIGWTEADIASADAVAALSGNGLLPGMDPWADNYGGHQFGHWAGQLGDGRAISLGEVLGPSGDRWQLQLKGAGPTPYSRRADGRAVLRSSIREFLCSEAMHHLGVPSSRALSLVATGEPVLRDMFYDGNARMEPGAIVCRMAPSFLRFGTFELPASRGDTALLARLVDFAVARDFPHLMAAGSDRDRRIGWLVQVAERTGRLMAQWMRVGFVHGVMNTDNLSILGLTLDFGPYGWLDDFDPDFTPNTTDAGQRRYRFGAQPDIAMWNLGCLAGALRALHDEPAALRGALDRYVEVFEAENVAWTARKLGLDPAGFGGPDAELATALFDRMRADELDFTLTFRALTDLDLAAPSPDALAPAAYDPARLARGRPAWTAWLERYAARARREDPARRAASMASANPVVVPRNYLVQQAIDRAERGDERGVLDLLSAVQRPYAPRAPDDPLIARRPDWARQAPGCSMLSCSS